MQCKALLTRIQPSLPHWTLKARLTCHQHSLLCVQKLPWHVRASRAPIFLSYFLFCFPLPRHFPSLPFSPSSPCFLSCLKASLACPQARKDSCLHRGKDTLVTLRKVPGHGGAELTHVSWVGKANPFFVSLKPAQPWAAGLMLSWGKEANPEPWSPRLPPSNRTLSFSVLHLLVLTVQEHICSLHPVNVSQCHDLLWVCCLLREISCFCQMSCTRGICAAVIYLYGS